jgi:hypothetical protein
MVVRGMFVAASVVLAGCASAPVKLNHRPAGHLTLPLKGVYTGTVIAPFIGPVSAKIAAEPSPEGFVANSRPGVAWDMIGGIQGFFGPIFVPFLFPGGVILTWTSTLPSEGKPGEGWLGVGGLKSVGVRTRMTSPDSQVEILAPDGRQVAILRLRPSAADEPPAADYPAMAQAVEDQVRSRLYDPDLVRSSSVRDYLAQFRTNSRLARDDVEFVFGAAVAAKNNMKAVAFPLVIRRANDETRRVFPEHDPEMATVRATFDEVSGIATLRADAFIDAVDVDRAFSKILGWHPRGLIIDLNACPGVTLASLRVASWLFDHPVDAGSFYGASHRPEGLAGTTDGFPRCEIATAADVGRAEATLDHADAATVIVRPEHETFSGPVAVLISKRTTTSAEPLAWLLKSTGRGRLFGQTTAGRPTISRPIDIGQGWDLWLAIADFRPAVGDPVTGKGVKADEEVSSKESAKRAARRWIRGQLAPSDGSASVDAAE